MKKNFKKTLSIISIMLAFIMLLGSSIPVYATEFPVFGTTQTSVSSRANSYPYPNLAYSLTTTTSWQTIATSSTGFNCNVFIKCMNTTTSGWGVVPSDIRMLGKSGNVVWSENGAVPGQGNRTFWCGSDVYTIQIRTQAGYGVAIAYQA